MNGTSFHLPTSAGRGHPYAEGHNPHGGGEHGGQGTVGSLAVVSQGVDVLYIVEQDVAGCVGKMST